ncbi:LamB/YcsF family protein [Pedococcus sp. 5OH_020]|uniref:LamB/YcsF family protein n=1 Tax=Pedococcus sp. 5OH_020 TaxID=2989814 RepID=UPI0022E9CCE2|nr:5-oxoprolinase subunit PxpA [Pedococcus sp. 5OH_020]
MSTVDLNADLGESFGRWILGDDTGMLRVVTSANVACGFHAGDPATLLSVCRQAAEAGVVVGAQVGYRDLAGFGRRFMDVAPQDLTADVMYQIGALQGLAAAAGTAVRYVKPHGALYNAVVRHEKQAAAVVAAVRAVDPGLAVLGLPGSVLLQLAETAGLRTVTEAFADRAYRSDGSLLPRTEPGAVLTDASEVAERMVRLVREGVVAAADGTPLRLRPGSLCVHGDSPGGVAMATAVRSLLEAAGVRVAAFLTTAG